jgi:hypothetical protein
LRLPVVVSATGALALLACAGAPIEPGVPRVVDRVVLSPYASHEDCVRVQAGDRLDWRYESTPPLAFDIHYREGNAVLAPIVRDNSSGDSGTYEARLGEDYCLGFEAGAAGATVSYRIEIRSASARR